MGSLWSTAENRYVEALGLVRRAGAGYLRRKDQGHTAAKRLFEYKNKSQFFNTL